MPVTSLSQMMKPGVVGATGDCATCGSSGFPATVTRVAIANKNMEKLNTPVQKAVEPPVPVAQPMQAPAIAAIIEEEEPKNRGGRPRLLTPNKPEEK